MSAPPQDGAAAGNSAATRRPAVGGPFGYDTDCACYVLLGRKWAPQIIAVLLSGPHRFSALHAAIPTLSDKVLSSRLDEFEAAGIVTRRQYLEIPTRVEYALTEAGRALEPAIREMARWSREFGLATGAGSAG